MSEVWEVVGSEGIWEPHLRAFLLPQECLQIEAFGAPQHPKPWEPGIPVQGHPWLLGISSDPAAPSCQGWMKGMGLGSSAPEQGRAQTETQSAFKEPTDWPPGRGHSANCMNLASAHAQAEKGSAHYLLRGQLPSQALPATWVWDSGIFNIFCTNPTLYPCVSPLLAPRQSSSALSHTASTPARMKYLKCQCDYVITAVTR